MLRRCANYRGEQRRGPSGRVTVDLQLGPRTSVSRYYMKQISRSSYVRQCVTLFSDPEEP